MNNEEYKKKEEVKKRLDAVIVSDQYSFQQPIMLSERIVFIDRDMNLIWSNINNSQGQKKAVYAAETQKCYEQLFDFNLPCQGCPVEEAIQSGEESVALYESAEGLFLQVSILPVYSAAGELIGFLCKAFDRDNIRFLFESLQAEDELLRGVIDNSQYHIYVKDIDGRFILVSRTLVEFLRKRGIENAVGVDSYRCFNARTAEQHRFNDQLVIKTKKAIHVDEFIEDNGRQLTFLTVKFPLLNQQGECFAVCGISTDITERIKMEQELQYMSFHDQLTGLYNRRFLEEEMKRLDQERQLPIAVIISDLNGLKLTNDLYGHAVGDELIKTAAVVFKSCCREEDIIARWGGDEFALLLPQTTRDVAEKVLGRIEQACSGTFVKDVPLSMAAGLAIKSEMGQHISGVIIDAESNMYKNKLTQKQSLKGSVWDDLQRRLDSLNRKREKRG